jgi:hypothetical protein
VASTACSSPEPGQPGYGIMTMSDVINKVVAQDLDPRGVQVGEIMTAHRHRRAGGRSKSAPIA